MYQALYTSLVAGALRHRKCKKDANEIEMGVKAVEDMFRRPK